ncbi:Hypothetical_protein [Hexamita inflata]|uniref:Hypothetical_protein n=1 Tax=Hexamita inflata TaxID=28002 RepID=A0AA86RG87_9EUKA|nr:Hypothetical protein HINF_LOCUS59319 [Hexamita inflata]
MPFSIQYIPNVFLSYGAINQAIQIGLSSYYIFIHVSVALRCNSAFQIQPINATRYVENSKRFFPSASRYEKTTRDMVVFQMYSFRSFRSVSSSSTGTPIWLFMASSERVPWALKVVFPSQMQSSQTTVVAVRVSHCSSLESESRNWMNMFPGFRVEQIRRCGSQGTPLASVRLQSQVSLVVLFWIGCWMTVLMPLVSNSNCSWMGIRRQATQALQKRVKRFALAGVFLTRQTLTWEKVVELVVYSPASQPLAHGRIGIFTLVPFSAKTKETARFASITTKQLLGTAMMSMSSQMVQFRRIFWKQPVPLYFVCWMLPTELFTLIRFTSYHSSYIAFCLSTMLLQSAWVSWNVTIVSTLQAYTNLTAGAPGSGKEMSLQWILTTTSLPGRQMEHRFWLVILSRSSNGTKFSSSQYVYAFPRMQLNGEKHSLKDYASSSTNCRTNIL